MPSALARTSDAIILVPGVLGSELVNAQGEVVWGMKVRLLLRQGLFRNVLDRLKLPDDGRDDGIRATGPIKLSAHLPLLTAIEPYGVLEERLRRVALRPDAVLAFGYDWRRSVEQAGKKLAAEAIPHLERWKKRFSDLPDHETRGLPQPQLSLVCHSMGGLVGRWFAELESGRANVRRIITMGTPFGGSLNAVQVLATGEYLPFNLFARSLREAARTMPGLYELVARYRCVNDVNKYRTISPSDLEGIGASLQRAEEASRTHERLSSAVAEAGESCCAVRSLVGTTQPTLQAVHFSDGTATFTEEIEGTDHRGDGTVYRYSASLKGGTPFYLPQSHGALAKSEEVAAFVEAVLTDRELGEFQASPGPGLRIPEAVRPNEPFTIEVLDGELGATCLIEDVETGQTIGMMGLQRHRDIAMATVILPEPGLFRVKISAGGFTPVENLVMVLAEQD